MEQREFFASMKLSLQARRFFCSGGRGDNLSRSLFFLFFLFAVFLSAVPLVHATEQPVQPPPIDLMSEAMQVAGYLLIFMVLAALVVHLGKRYQPGLGGMGPICIEDGRNLAPGVGLRLVRVGSRAWLLGVTKDRISMLAEISAQEIAAAAIPQPPSSTTSQPKEPAT